MTKLTLASLLVVSSAFAQVVPWTAETTLVVSNLPGDPAVLVGQSPGLSTPRVLGTDTAQNGVYVWGLDGQLAQVLNTGLVRSVDSRGDFVVVTSASDGLLLLEARGGITVGSLQPPSVMVPTPGQVAVGTLPDGGYEIWVDTSSLELRHFEVSPIIDGGVTLVTLPSVIVPEVPSGLALDDRTRRLYVGQPNLGVLAVSDGGREFVLSIDAGTLGPLVGGLDLFLAANGTALLFSTSPGTDQVMVHLLSGNSATFGTALEIGAPDGGAARVRSPRYLDVYERTVPGRSSGLLVVQDGLAGNYKLVGLERVAAVFPLPAPYVPGIVTPDAGTAMDAGVDAGTGTGGGSGGTGGGSGGSTGTPGGPAPGSEPTPSGCGCTGGPFAMLPALLLLWWSRRLRSSPPRS